jgi:hypothetical protein
MIGEENWLVVDKDKASRLSFKIRVVEGFDFRDLLKEFLR